MSTVHELPNGAVEINVDKLPTIICDSASTANALCDALCAFFAEKRAIEEHEQHVLHAPLPEHAFS